MIRQLVVVDIDLNAAFMIFTAKDARLLDVQRKQIIPNACYLVGIIKWVRSLENKEKDYIWLGAHM